MAGSSIALAAAAWLGSPAAQAMDIATGQEDLKLRWDNTFKYSAAARTRGPDAALTRAAVNSNNVNQDDGDQNFQRSLISNRIDLVSEFDAVYRSRLGLRVSAAGWYDAVYNRGNGNPGFAGGGTPNQTSVPGNAFTRETREVHGRHVEVLDAFVFSAFDLGQDRPATVRLGQHGMVWGETLFFGTNGIAGGMAPVDVVKLLSVPSTQFKEAIRPVPMISAQWQISPKIMLGAYYQTRWVRSRLPAVGSYFSNSDVAPEGGEQILLAGPDSPFLANAPRQSDLRPSNGGQGGLQLRASIDDFDLGVYLIRFHAKEPMPVASVGPAPVLYVPGPGCVIPGSVQTGPGNCALAAPIGYRLAYGEGITSFGVSQSRTFGNVNIASEGSLRWNQPLNSALASDASALGAPATDNQDNPGYPVGKTAHLNVSAIWSIQPNALFREGNLVAELGWNRVLAVTRRADLVDPNASRDAVAVRALLQPTYRQVTPGVDLSPLVGLGWAPRGSRSSITTVGMPQNGNGDMTLGLDATYQDVWRASLAYTHYIGSAGGFLTATPNGGQALGFKQYYADRDFVAFSVRRTF